MTSENYRTLLNNAYKNRELSAEDFDNTLMQFAGLFNKEKTTAQSGRKICSNGMSNKSEGVTETEYGVDDENFNEILPKLEPKLKDGDTVNINSTMNEDDEDTSEVDSLYSGADNRGVEFGINNEDFDRMMEELKETDSPTIKVNENINPRIKKSDLINYLKNRK